jgi:prefoldin subunit 5
MPEPKVEWGRELVGKMDLLSSELDRVGDETSKLREEFVVFRSKIDTLTSVGKYTGGVLVLVAIGLIGTTFKIAWDASAFHSDVISHNVQLGKLETKIDSLGTKMDALDRAIVKLTDKIETLAVPSTRQTLAPPRQDGD